MLIKDGWPSLTKCETKRKGYKSCSKHQLGEGEVDTGYMAAISPLEAKVQVINNRAEGSSVCVTKKIFVYSQ